MYTPKTPANPHHEKVEEFTEEFLAERRKVVMERENQRLAKYRNVSVKPAQQPWESSWVLWVVVAGVAIFVVYKNKRVIMRKLNHTFM